MRSVAHVTAGAHVNVLGLCCSLKLCWWQEALLLLGPSCERPALLCEAMLMPMALRASWGPCLCLWSSHSSMFVVCAVARNLVEAHDLCSSWPNLQPMYLRFIHHITHIRNLHEDELLFWYKLQSMAPKEQLLKQLFSKQEKKCPDEEMFGKERSYTCSMAKY